VLVDFDGSARVVAAGLWFPNGMAITPDGARLLVAETHGQRISSFVIGSDGSLTDRGVFAEFDDVRPDGICLDASGALWMASPATGQVLRVAEGGRVLDRIDLENGPSCCALGGSDADSKTLYVSSGPYHDEAEARSERRGRIVAIDL
jgi:sugar lactone lactonase YvrE